MCPQAVMRLAGPGLSVTASSQGRCWLTAVQIRTHRAQPFSLMPLDLLLAVSYTQA